MDSCAFRRRASFFAVVTLCVFAAAAWQSCATSSSAVSGGGGVSSAPMQRPVPASNRGGSPLCTGGDKPVWYPMPNKSHPDFRYFSGVAIDAPSLAEGRRLAYDDGLKQLSATLCKSVVTSQQYIEDETCVQTGGGYTYYVLVALPVTEYSAYQRQCQDRVAVGGLCEGCPSTAWLDEVTEGLSAKGLTLAPARLSTQNTGLLLQGDFRDLKGIARQHEAYRAVAVKIEAEKKTIQDDVHYVWLRGVMQVVDLDSGRVIDSYSTDTFKGAAFDEPGAWKKALENVVDDLKIHLSEVSFTPASAQR